jgi:5-formyltetrahydrofolate cyclo-ligase
MTYSSLNRKDLRKLIRKKRIDISQNSQRSASVQLSTQLRSKAYIKEAKSIALYVANDGEIDPMVFIQWCWQENKAVYLPVIHPFTKHQLLFLRYEADTALVPNKYGILEPKLDVRNVCPFDKLNVLCTPLVAFDITGARLGMGGGFYDRTLAHWYKKKQSNSKANHAQQSFIPIGLAHDGQLVNEVPVASWDIPLPEIITPDKCYQF